MSFILHPGALSVFNSGTFGGYYRSDYVSTRNFGFYRGVDKDNGLFLFPRAITPGYAPTFQWTIADTIFPSIRIVEMDIILRPDLSTRIGYGTFADSERDNIAPVWHTTANGGWFLFVSGSKHLPGSGGGYAPPRWILTQSDPRKGILNDLDEFFWPGGYSVNAWEGYFPSASTTFRQFLPEADGTEYTLQLFFPRWVNSTGIYTGAGGYNLTIPVPGVYEPVDGAAGNKTIGSQIDGSWTLFQKEKTVYIGEVAICR